MRVTIAFNAYFEDSSSGPQVVPQPPQSRGLVEEFTRRGHQVLIVHPLHVYQADKEVRAAAHYGWTNGTLSALETHSPIRGDVFFVRGIKGNGIDLQKAIAFLDLLYNIERQVNLTFNSAESTSFEFKPKQRALSGLPWIPRFHIDSTDQLINLIRGGHRIIAKPKIGFGGAGISYLEKVDDSQQFTPELLDDYIFEDYVDDKFERRFIFLDGQIVAQRIIERDGVPISCNSIDRYHNENPSPDELNIVRQVMDQTGMYYGCVDFIGDYILEINGSGTGTNCDTIDETSFLYDLASDIVDVVESMVVI